MKVIKRIFCASVCLVLTGCATVQRYDHNSDYRKSQTTKAINTSSGMSASDIKDYYSIPSVKSNQSGGDISLVPPGAKKLS
ncbi:MAG: hypothetical protein A3C55_04465 [Gammaproteobacteria bacterium RIFCSPHIGHO2_02_FULL_42_13]|nr:MAG: hypothetical protein A3C55_04465 [Gammaproteobacteria bacterium RIFCSPHIGHO2_02_FULL_42_13]